MNHKDTIGKVRNSLLEHASHGSIFVTIYLLCGVIQNIEDADGLEHD